MSLIVSPLRGLGIKCQFCRSASATSKPAVFCCSGESALQKFTAACAMSAEARERSPEAAEDAEDAAEEPAARASSARVAGGVERHRKTVSAVAAHAAREVE